MTTISIQVQDIQTGDIVKLSEHNSVLVTGAPIRTTAKQVTLPTKSTMGWNTPSMTRNKSTMVIVTRNEVAQPEITAWDSCPECGDFFAWCPKTPQFHGAR